MPTRCWLSVFLLIFTFPAVGQPLHERIDAAVEAGHKGPFAGTTRDDEFLRRIWLDLAGVIPSASETRAFLADKQSDKRGKLVDRLLTGPDFPRRMREAFSVMFEERRTTADSPAPVWEDYLLRSFAADKPWNQLAREILVADVDDPATKVAAHFYLQRSGDAHLLTKDVGRLFLGRDMECARCHDHPTIADYKQADYFGLYAFLNRSYVFKSKGAILFAEKGSPGKVNFESVFTMQKGATGPHLPGLADIDEPAFAKGQEFEVKPEPKKGIAGRPKFSARAVLGKKLTEADPKSLFVRNSANRLWFLMMGRGVVHPLDRHHAANPPAQAKLLDVLSDGLVETKFDVKRFLGEIARTRAYQRSSRLPAKAEEMKEGTFAAAELRALAPEQLLYSLAQATGALEPLLAKGEEKQRLDPLWRGKTLRTSFEKPMKAFVAAFGSRPGEAETEFQPSLAGALYLSNEAMIRGWLKADGNNLMARLEAKEAASQVAEELYVSVLSRLPTAEEQTEVAEHLKKRASQRTQGLSELAWALLASSEFRLNH